MFKEFRKNQIWENIVDSFLELIDSKNDLKNSSSLEDYRESRLKHAKTRDKCQKYFDDYINLNDDKDKDNNF
jgi:hypothetical protein